MKKIVKALVCFVFIILCFSLYACSGNSRGNNKDTWVIHEGKDKFGEKNGDKFIVTSYLLSGKHSSSIANNEKAKFLIAYYPEQDKLILWPYDEYGNKAVELGLAETWKATIKSGDAKIEKYVTLTSDKTGLVFYSANSNEVLRTMLKNGKAQLLIEGFTEYVAGCDWLVNEFETKSFEKCLSDWKHN